MNKPAIMVVDDKPETLDTLERALRHRYEHDYLIISHTSAAAALGHLTELGAAGRPVAVVLAAATLAATSGTEFLATVRGAQPAAKRVLIVPRGGTAAPSLRVPTPLLQDRSAAQPVLQAMAFGAIDVRHRSLKRVASAVGEGSIAATLVAQYLQVGCPAI